MCMSVNEKLQHAIDSNGSFDLSWERKEHGRGKSDPRPRSKPRSSLYKVTSRHGPMGSELEAS